MSINDAIGVLEAAGYTITPPPFKGPCQAYQTSDTMLCPRCVLQWDVNDPEPPKCLTS